MQNCSCYYNTFRFLELDRIFVNYMTTCTVFFEIYPKTFFALSSSSFRTMLDCSLSSPPLSLPQSRETLTSARTWWRRSFTSDEFQVSLCYIRKQTMACGGIALRNPATRLCICIHILVPVKRMRKRARDRDNSLVVLYVGIYAA